MATKQRRGLLERLSRDLAVWTRPVSIRRIISWMQDDFEDYQGEFETVTRRLFPDAATEILSPDVSTRDSVERFLRLFAERYFPFDETEWFDLVETEVMDAEGGEDVDTVILRCWSRGPQSILLGIDEEDQGNVDGLRAGLLAMMVCVPNKVVDRADGANHVPAQEVLLEQHGAPRATLKSIPEGGWRAEELAALAGHPRWEALIDCGKWLTSTTGNMFLDTSWDELEMGMDVRLDWSWDMAWHTQAWKEGLARHEKIHRLFDWLEGHDYGPAWKDKGRLVNGRFSRMVKEVKTIIGEVHRDGSPKTVAEVYGPDGWDDDGDDD